MLPPAVALALTSSTAIHGNRQQRFYAHRPGQAPTHHQRPADLAVKNRWKELWQESRYRDRHYENALKGMYHAACRKSSGVP